MTAQTIVENIRRVFPDISIQQILKDLDQAQKIFCNDLDLLQKRATLNDIHSNTAWELPNDFVRLYDIRAYDINEQNIDLEDYYLAHEVEFNKLFIYSMTRTPIKKIPDSISLIYIHYIYKPIQINTEDSIISIPEDFAKALEHYLLQDYFSKYPVQTLIEGRIVTQFMVNLASWHYKRYLEIKQQAKIYAKRRDFTEGDAVFYGQAGRFSLPKRTNNLSAGSTMYLDGLASIFTKYARFTLVSTQTPEQNATPIAVIGYNTLSATQPDSNSFTISSTNEFEFDTHIECNNGDVSWEQSDNSTIAFLLPNGWGTIDIEIWER